MSHLCSCYIACFNAWLVVTIAITTSATVSRAAPIESRVKCGIDNLIDTQFEMFAGKRVVLVTHAAARAQTGRGTADEFFSRSNVNVLRVLTPEHGYYGVITAGATVGNDSLGSVPLISLYGALRRPNKAMIEDADAVVLDLQDIGTRSYTYISTMTEVMDACAEYNKKLIILDRPNPLGGNVVDGSPPDDSMQSFVARIPVPYVHGMTIGELATMITNEGWLSRDVNGRPRKCDLTVVKCKRWQRAMRWEETGLSWYPTSPNIPCIESVRGYPLTGLSGELGFYSIGIGSSTPFAVLGGPEFKADTVLEQRLRSNGVVARFGYFQPMAGKYAKQVCAGYFLSVQSDSTFKPFRAGLVVLYHGYRNPIEESDRKRMFNKVIGSTKYLDMLSKGASLSDLYIEADKGKKEFEVKRNRYLLY